MPITVIVRSAAGGEDARLTFDGAQRVVIGRGASSDVRLPDASVSHRHASLRAQGADFVVVDEESMNGTFVGDVRVAPRTSRLVRSGNIVRVGRVRLEIRMAAGPVTRDLALATRDLALVLVARALEEVGTDATARIRVVEGRDQGTILRLANEDYDYVVGRGPQCDLPVADADASREHVCVRRREGAVVIRDLGAKNGTWLGQTRVPLNGDAIWRPAQMLKIGRTVLALEEPVSEALARIESAPDEPMPALEAAVSASATGVLGASGPLDGTAKPGPATDASTYQGATNEAATKEAASARSGPMTRARTETMRWSLTDGLVMTAALVVLALSLGGIVWLLHG